MSAEHPAATTEPLCPGCGRPVSECQAEDVDESPAAITPPTEEEIDRFCEEANMVRPDPNDERACASFASWLVEWRHTGLVPRV